MICISFDAVDAEPVVVEIDREMDVLERAVYPATTVSFGPDGDLAPLWPATIRLTYLMGRIRSPHGDLIALVYGPRRTDFRTNRMVSSDILARMHTPSNGLFEAARAVVRATLEADEEDRQLIPKP